MACTPARVCKAQGLLRWFCRALGSFLSHSVRQDSCFNRDLQVQTQLSFFDVNLDTSRCLPEDARDRRSLMRRSEYASVMTCPRMIFTLDVQPGEN